MTSSKPEGQAGEDSEKAELAKARDEATAQVKVTPNSFCHICELSSYQYRPPWRGQTKWLRRSTLFVPQW